MIDKKLVAVSRLFYEHQLSKTQIAERLNITITHVNRLLREAIKSEIVKITIQAPNFEDLEVELKEKFGLQDALVVAVPENEDSLRTELGIAAARYFEDKVKRDQKVGIGSGQTIFEMVSKLDEKNRPVKFYPIAAIIQRDLLVKGIDANTAVNVIWFKSRPSATAYRLELFFPQEPITESEKKAQELLNKTIVEKLIREISDLDYYFFSCSHLRDDSRLIEIAQSCGMSFDDLENSGIIGDFLFSTINKEGEYVANCIERSCFRLDLSSLKKVSNNPQKKVILIAGGKEKFHVIRAGIYANPKLFNVLVTDVNTAQLLLKNKE